jgi:hypothetical protein
MRRRMLDMHVGMLSRSVTGQLSVEFSNEIQGATAKGLIFV